MRSNQERDLFTFPGGKTDQPHRNPADYTGKILLMFSIYCIYDTQIFNLH